MLQHLARLTGIFLAVSVFSPSASGQVGPNPQESPPASAPAQPTRPPSPDPFAQLKPVVPRDKLPPLASVRIRDPRVEADRASRRSITVSLGSTPKGAAVYYGGKLLGTTPLNLSAPRGSTPLDVVIKRTGFMTLRTRLMRRTSRGYFFKLTPAKLH